MFHFIISFSLCQQIQCIIPTHARNILKRRFIIKWGMQSFEIKLKSNILLSLINLCAITIEIPDIIRLHYSNFRFVILILHIASICCCKRMSILNMMWRRIFLIATIKLLFDVRCWTLIILTGIPRTPARSKSPLVHYEEIDLGFNSFFVWSLSPLRFQKTSIFKVFLYKADLFKTSKFLK